MFKTGPAGIDVPQDFAVELTAETDFELLQDDENGRTLARSKNKRLRFKAKEDVSVYVAVPETIHWGGDIVEEPPDIERPDPNPIEIPEDMARPETLQEKMERFLGAMVRERYGSDSQEFETFEESLDFDMADAEEPLSGFEVADDMPEEFLDEPAARDSESSSGNPATDTTNPDDPVPQDDPVPEG